MVCVRVVDPLDVTSSADRRREAEELLRPLRRMGIERALTPAARERLDDPRLGHVLEIRELDAEIPEGRQALSGLFEDLCAGLEQLPGPVALTMRVEPEAADLLDEDADESVPRRIAFTLRVAAAAPLPAALRARAWSLCLSRPTSLASVVGGDATRGPRADAANPGAALALLSLARASDAVGGRRAAGPLPRSGAVLGRVRQASGANTPWRLSWEQRRHHVLVAGASGCGKSTTLLRLVADDLEHERMVVVLDPHGDLADDVLSFTGDGPGVCMVDPREPRTEPLDLLDPDPRRAAAHLCSAVAELWPSNFAGPVWHRGISLALRALAARPEGDPVTLADVGHYLVDSQYRDQVIAGLTDSLRREAEHEARAWSSTSGDTSAVAWLAGKLTPLTDGPAAPLFDRLPWRELNAQIRADRAMVVSLPLGELGTESTRLIGRMLLTRLTTAIAAQGSLPEELRRPVSLLVDEAHLFAGPALAGLFAQARKFHTSVTVASQAPSSLGAQLSSVLTNAETLLVGRLPAPEAAVIRDRAGDRTALALPTLSRHHVVVVDAQHEPAHGPFVLAPVPPPRPIR